MEKEDRPSRNGINRGFDPLDTISRKAIESQLSEALKKVEHRVEVLTSISLQQSMSGYYELAEAYRKQAAESKASAQSIRKLLAELKPRRR
jgi:phage baseplate assembly protein W